MENGRNLSRRALELLDAPNDVRIEHIKKPIFVPYSKAAGLLEEMEELLVHPKTNRMPNMLIVSRSNNGKTEILKEFLARHPAEARVDHDAVYAPVIYLQCPPGPSEDIFLNAALMLLGVQPKRNEAPQLKLAQLMDLLARVSTQVLLLDELNALLAGSVTKQRFFLNMLKYLSNELKISIVAAGTKDALQAVRSEPQIESRFPARMLPRWQENEDFRRLLYSLEYAMPLRETSEIYKGEIARAVYGISDGVLGDVTRLLKSAAEHAIVSGSERITMDVISGCSFVRRGRDESIDIL